MVKNQLQKLISQCDNRASSFEDRYSLATIVKVINRLPDKYINEAISFYQKIIRNNMWYFPILQDVRLESFLIRWGDVHATYFQLAEEIFIELLKGGSFCSLATKFWLTRVIQSETMRGWVGKRSPSGLDELCNIRIRQLEKLLASLNNEDVENILTYECVYANNSPYITAEREFINLFRTYHNEVGRELTVDMLSKTNNSTQLILRNYCCYSIIKFNEMYRQMKNIFQNPKKNPSENLFVTTESVACFAKEKRDRILKLADELKILNYLNLNIEAKYSFKSWAGLMHVLVFFACKEATGIEIDIYDMCGALK